jgi:hypothetical protein
MAERAYRYRRYDHKKIEDQIEETKKKLAALEERKNILHRLIELMPDELTILASGMNYDCCGFNIYIPWDLKLFEQYSTILKNMGMVENRSWESQDKADRYTYFRFKDEERSWFQVLLALDGDRKSETKSACILVPLKVEKKDVVVAYDHVCPAEHPELFKLNEQTNELEYIGDNLFPAIQVNA